MIINFVFLAASYAWIGEHVGTGQTMMTGISITAHGRGTPNIGGVYWTNRMALFMQQRASRVMTECSELIPHI